MPINITPYLCRPEHVVRCAFPGCNKLGLRHDVCSACREYHCPEHLNMPIQGNEAHPEHSALIDPAHLDQEFCFGCGNPPARLGRARAGEGQGLDAAIAALKVTIEQSEIRKQFGALLIDRFNRLIEQLDLIESFLEKQLWAGLFVRGLDRYLEPQVVVHDYAGQRIVRVDFASTLLRIAIFTDGHEFHDPPAQQALDTQHDTQLRAMGWLVKRYWYEEVVPDINACVDDIYDIVCKRISRMHDTGLPIAPDPPAAEGGAAVANA
jgi:very-short-patch-repair endonuclease